MTKFTDWIAGSVTVANTGIASAIDSKHDQTHTVASTVQHTFPSGTVNYLREDGTRAEPPSGSGTPSGTVLAETTYSLAAGAGTSSEYSRGDHTHGSPDDLVSGTAHSDLSTGVHSAGTATLATTANITTHANLTGTHGAGTIASLINISDHTSSTNVHGAGTISGLADIVAHNGSTAVHGAGTVASMTALNAHTILTAAHGVAGTIAAKADITDTVLVLADVTTNDVTSTKHGFVPKSTANTAQFLRNDTTPTWATPAGGSDPWTYLTLAAAFTTTSATAQAVTGLAFTPSANTKYDIYGMFYVKTVASAVVPRVGLAWPSGLTQGVATVYITAGASTQYLVNLNAAASGLTSVGAIASTAFWPSQMNCVIDAGATPSGSIHA